VVGLLPRVLRIKVLWVFDLSLSLAGRHEDLGTSLGLLDDIPGLLLLALLRHAIFNQVVEVVIFVRVFLPRKSGDLWQCELLLYLGCLLNVARVNKETQVPTEDLLVGCMDLIKRPKDLKRFSMAAALREKV